MIDLFSSMNKQKKSTNGHIFKTENKIIISVDVGNALQEFLVRNNKISFIQTDLRGGRVEVIIIHGSVLEVSCLQR